MLLTSLKNRPVTVFGKGVEGKAVQEFLEQRGCPVTVVEDPNPVLTGLVVKSPGVSLYRNDIKFAKRFGTYFTSGTNLFMESALSQAETRPLMIGVTGTKGKSTTSSLVAHLLQAQGNRVLLCGNIGKPAISYANELEKYDVVVVELSSYQCADLEYGFDISVLVNLFPEHIDWHLTTERYYKDKLNLFANRQEGQVGILNAQDARTAMYVKGLEDIQYYNSLETVHVRGDYFYNGNTKLFSTKNINLLGSHNLENVCAALSVVLQASETLDGCEEALKTFEALPHRLQTVAYKKGVRYVDDSISTTPETAIAAMKAFGSSNIILIAGGFDREQDYKKLAEFVAKNKDIVVLTLPETGSRILDDVLSVGGRAIFAGTMKSAVAKANELATYGDTVLLSPAAPSYGRYKNFQERGLDFLKYVNEIKE